MNNEELKIHRKLRKVIENTAKYYDGTGILEGTDLGAEYRCAANTQGTDSKGFVWMNCADVRVAFILTQVTKDLRVVKGAPLSMYRLERLVTRSVNEGDIIREMVLEYTRNTKQVTRQVNIMVRYSEYDGACLGLKVHEIYNKTGDPVGNKGEHVVSPVGKILRSRR